MIDDHDRCQWVNVSSGTRLPAHPGCPGQNPDSRKMVVCVCVCIYVYGFMDRLG